MKCKICESSLNSFQIARTPIAGYRCNSAAESTKEPYFNLRLFFCNYCNLGQYRITTEALRVLDKLYTNHSSTYYLTEELDNYLVSLIYDMETNLGLNEDNLVLEIGCNDGRLLDLLRKKTNCKILGFEPSQQFLGVWNDNQIEVINEYFSLNTIHLIGKRKIDFILIRHVFEHIPDICAFFDAIKKISSPNTIILLEVPYFKTILRLNRLDNISYSHLNYFTIKSINELLKRFNMGILSYKLVNTDGGSILFHIYNNTFSDPSIMDNIEENEIVSFLDSIKKIKKQILKKIYMFKKNEIVGYGAGAKGQHLLHILKLAKYIDHVIDDTPGYENNFIPGTKISIKNNEFLKQKEIKAVINLAPTHTNVIRKKIPGHLEFINIL